VFSNLNSWFLVAPLLKRRSDKKQLVWKNPVPFSYYRLIGNIVNKASLLSLLVSVGYL